MRYSKIRNCPMCGDSFEAHSSQQMYCSDQCYDMHAQVKELYHNTERNAEPRHFKCPNCGKDVYTRKASTKYCSDECRHAFHNAKKKKTYTCVVCGKTFTDLQGRHKYCSEECATAVDRERNREWNAKNKEHVRQYRKDNREHITAVQREYRHANKDRVNALTHASRARCRKRVKEQRVFDYHAGLLERARIEGNKPNTVRNQDQFLDSIGIVRSNTLWAYCAKCGTSFPTGHDASSSCSLLKIRSKTGVSPCPLCGDPVGTRFSTEPELDLLKRYPNFTEQHFRPAWMGGKELDLYDPVNRIAIEFNGIIWHSKHSKSSTLHKQKADMCENNGVQLVQIYETEWVQKKNIVLDKLDAIMHKNMTRIMARKLAVDTAPSSSEVNAFMDANHIQGKANYQWAVVLRCEGEIVAACTFKYGTGYSVGGHVDGTVKYWELNRFATKLNTCVQGGLSRCIKAFAKAHPDVHEVISFADRRWTCPTRSAYASSGFVEIGRQQPNYMYTDLNPSNPLLNKQHMRKSKLRLTEVWDEYKTEAEMAKELGFYRIYDAGKIKYSIRL